MTAGIPMLVLAAALCGAAAGAAPIRTFRARDYGAAADGKTDSGEAIRKAVAAATASAGPAEVMLDAGVYRVAAGGAGRFCIPIDRASNLTLRGSRAGTKLIVTDPTCGGILVTSSTNVTVRDVTIDYDPLPYTQGVVRRVDASGSFDLEIAPECPTPDADNFLKAHEPYGKWGMIMDAATRRIKAGTPDHYMTPKWEKVGDRTWRFFTMPGHYTTMLRHMGVGDTYVHLARGHAGSAILAQSCDGVTLQGITVHASPGLVVGLVANRGRVLVDGLQARFAPESGRLLTANADGVHCQQNRTGPIIRNCRFEGMADDSINMYCPPNVLHEIRTPTTWLVSPGCMVMPGDRLQVLDPITGRVRGEVKALKVEVEGRRFRLELERGIDGAAAGADHRSADTLYNLDACNAGFRIERNLMDGNRRYGCLLRAGAGVVAGNTFRDTTGAGVVLTNEPDWPEGPVPWDITIRNNRFDRSGTCLGYADTPGGAQLIVRPSKLGHGLAEAPAIRGVVVENNTFVDPLGPAVYIGGAIDVQLRGNRIDAADDAPRLRPGPAIRVERSRRVEVRGGSVRDRRKDTTQAVESDATDEVRVDGRRKARAAP